MLFYVGIKLLSDEFHGSDLCCFTWVSSSEECWMTNWLRTYIVLYEYQAHFANPVIFDKVKTYVEFAGVVMTGLAG